MFGGGELVRLVKDCLFPIFCFGCRQEGQWWCEKCFWKDFFGGEFFCPVCHLKNLDGKNCLNCQAVSSLQAVAAFFNYQSSAAAKELIKNFKYNFAHDIDDVWRQVSAQCLRTVWQSAKWPTDYIQVIPVPLHTKRERERGFNQANLMALGIFEELKKDHQNIYFDGKSLKRVKFTRQQAKLNREERLKNLKEAFEWLSDIPPKKNIILVDDVFTSGSTMQECARVLKRAGAQRVYGLVMARD